MENHIKTAQLALQRALTLEDVPFSTEGVAANVEKWASNKGDLIKSLEKHPNWNPQELAVVGTLVETRRTNKQQVRDILNLIVSNAHQVIEDQEKRKSVEKALLQSGNLLSEKNIKEDDISAIEGGTEDWLIKPSSGMKSSRFVLKTLEAAGVSMDKNEALRWRFTEFADAVSPYEKELDYSLSANPADYALMSYGRSWTSCHRISGDYGPGEYGAGGFSYMTDESSLVFTLLEKNEDRKPGRMCLEPKLYRQMILMDRSGELFVQSRMYPTASGVQGLYREIRRVVHEVMSTVHGFQNSWAAPHKGNHDVVNTVTHLFYPDYQYFSGSCRTSVVLEDKEYFQNGGYYSRINVGATPYCLCCGENTIQRSENLHCYNCRDNIGQVYEFYAERHDEDW